MENLIPGEDFDEIVRGKGIMDGSKTLFEAASALREYADYLERQHHKGRVLLDAIEDDYGFVQ